jgi:hypothetical protein
VLLLERTVTAPPITQPGPMAPPTEAAAAAAERAEIAAAVAARRAAVTASGVVSAVPTASTSLRPVTAATGGGNMLAPVKGVITPRRCVTTGAGGPGAGVGAGPGCGVELWPSKVAFATTTASTRKVSPTCAVQNEHSLRPRKGGGVEEGGGRGGGGGDGGQRGMRLRTAALG